MLDFIVGGTDTLSTATTFLIRQLIHDTTLQKRVQKELDSIPGEISSQDFALLPLLEALCFEV